LASNAVKFTESGEVMLRATLVPGSGEDTLVRFEVSDTGIGVDPDAERLFEAFSQADSSTTRMYGGTGLGLAICKRLVALMGGEIGVDSAPSQGSSFWFTVPFASAGSLPPDTAPPGPRELRVLVVDDQATARLVLGDLVGRAGATVETADSATSALSALGAGLHARAPYDAVVVDAAMPGASDLVGQVSAAGGSRPGLVLLRTEGADGNAAVPPGDVVLDKPVRAAALLAALPQAASAGRARRESRPRPRVLVVDGRPVSQMVTRGMAEHLGYEVAVAADEAEAVSILASDEIAAVLLDCPSPQTEGCGTASAIRRLDGSRRQVPVVAVVAAGSPADASWCRDAGVDALLTRPVSLQGLDDVLSAWTGSMAGRDS
jgi:two-component system sensor histidine kinase/response regulator